jgi:hypothetical protein
MATYVEPVGGLNAGVHIHQPGIYRATAYALKPEYAVTGAKHQEFMDFYEDSVIEWLKHNEIAHAYAWLMGHYLICVGSPKMVDMPWVGAGGIRGLSAYLAKDEPLPVKHLRSFED